MSILFKEKMFYTNNPVSEHIGIASWLNDLQDKYDIIDYRIAPIEDGLFIVVDLWEKIGEEEKALPLLEEAFSLS